MTYEKKRPYVSANIEREIKTEAGHTCAVRHCPEHIAEIHHIDENRENNDPANLILLCDKHHKLAHNGVISRQDLRRYKKMLAEPPIGRDSLQSSSHDRALLETINNIFPFDLIKQIQNEPFGKFVPKTVIDPFDTFIYKAEDPLFCFTDSRLEELRTSALHKAHKFLNHFSQQSGGLPSRYDYIDPYEAVRRNPETTFEYWIKYADDTRKLAQEFCDVMLRLRSEARNF